MMLTLQVFSISAHAQATLNWTGKVSSDWATAGNWNSNTVPGTMDQVQIGMIAFVNQPVVSSNSQVGSITFGNVQPIVFTVLQNAVLQVTGNIIQMHSTNNIAPTTMLTGNGSLTCNAFFVGNSVTSKIVMSKTTGVISTIANLSINTNLTLYTASSDLLSGGDGDNNSSFSLQAGRITIAGQIRTYHQIPIYMQSLTSVKPYAKFSVDIVGSQSPTLMLGDSVSVSLANQATDTICFNHHLIGTGIATVNYFGVNQLIYTNAYSAIGNTGYTYQNLIISGSGIKTIVGPTGNTLLAGGSIYVAGGSLVTKVASSSIKVQAQ